MSRCSHICGEFTPVKYDDRKTMRTSAKLILAAIRQDASRHAIGCRGYDAIDTSLIDVSQVGMATSSVASTMTSWMRLFGQIEYTIL